MIQFAPPPCQKNAESGDTRSSQRNAQQAAAGGQPRLALTHGEVVVVVILEDVMELRDVSVLSGELSLPSFSSSPSAWLMAASSLLVGGVRPGWPRRRRANTKNQ